MLSLAALAGMAAPLGSLALPVLPTELTGDQGLGLAVAMGAAGHATLFPEKPWTLRMGGCRGAFSPVNST